MKKLTSNDLKQLVLNFFEAKILGDVELNRTFYIKILPLLIWCLMKAVFYHARRTFTKTHEKAFLIKNREYSFKTILADQYSQTTMLDFTESYPDPGGKVYRNPQVAVCQIVNGKTYRTRHYYDPKVPYQYLSKEIVDSVFIE